jgi:hypothetical protein
MIRDPLRAWKEHVKFVTWQGLIDRSLYLIQGCHIPEVLLRVVQVCLGLVDFNSHFFNRCPMTVRYKVSTPRKPANYQTNRFSRSFRAAETESRLRWTSSTLRGFSTRSQYSWALAVQFYTGRYLDCECLNSVLTYLELLLQNLGGLVDVVNFRLLFLEFLCVMIYTILGFKTI